MSFELSQVLEERAGENFQLHTRHLNPQLARVLRTIGFDKFYVRGEGSYLWDADGRRYLDLLSGFGVYALGRSHPTIKRALHDGLDADLANLVQMDCALLPGLLAEQLVQRCHPAISRAFFCNSGAEAIEAAIKFARRATGRDRVLYADHAFHGLTSGALALNGAEEFRSGFGRLLPTCDAVPFGDIDALERALRRRDVAAFIVEPIQGKGVYEAPDDYWPAVQELCRRYRTLFVADEVQTGLGRTGRFFCYEHWGLAPDIITVSKALSGGYVPVGAVLCTDKVFSSVYRSMQEAVIHSSTFGNNNLAMVAGLATLAVFDDEDIVDRASRSGELFVKALEPLVERHEVLREVRGKGLMIGIEFAEPTSPGPRRRWKAVERMRPALFSQLIVVPLFHRHRVLTQVAADNTNVVKLLPPLVAGEEEIALFVNALDDVLTDAQDGSTLYVEFGRIMARNALRRARPAPEATGRARPAPEATGRARPAPEATGRAPI